MSVSKNIFLRFLSICLLILFLGSCQSTSQYPEIQAEEIAEVMSAMTDIMVHDVTNPPLASRFYAYTCLSGAEVMRGFFPRIDSLLQKVNAYPQQQVYTSDLQQIHPQLAALYAMYLTASKLQPSGFELEENLQALSQKYSEKGLSNRTIEASLAYGREASKTVMAYAALDRYNQTSNSVRYSPSDFPGSWYPTPPGYFPPVEPYFGTLRPFLLDTVVQFSVPVPVAYAEEEDSPFFLLMREVYDLELDQQKKEIASFWDCNPFALEDKGHLMIGLKKISPGAHWMGIANIAIKDAGIDFADALEVNTALSLTMHDAFLSCWREKYSSNRIRPETAIRKLLDPKYVPLLQTPPFPEYLSGHSVVSTASAVLLTSYFGDNFAYTDTVEVKYGLESRRFQSFEYAAAEASISRLYGGIHFRDAIEEGQKQGRAVGQYAVQKIDPPLLIK